MVHGMSGRTFVDTNILIYAHDADADRKRDIARELLQSWDALIVASAVRSGADRILSEDLNPGQAIAGVTVVNPFIND